MRWHPKGSTQKAPAPWSITGGSAFAGEIRELGLPADHPTDVAYFTRSDRLTSSRASACRRRPRSRLASRGRRPRPTRCRSRCCAPTRCTSKRFLFEHARAPAEHTMRFGWQVDGLPEDDDRRHACAPKREQRRRARSAGARNIWSAATAAAAWCAASSAWATRARRASSSRYLGGRMFSRPMCGRPTLYRDHLAQAAPRLAILGGQPGDALAADHPLNGDDEFLLLHQGADDGPSRADRGCQAVADVHAPLRRRRVPSSRSSGTGRGPRAWRWWRSDSRRARRGWPATPCTCSRRPAASA